jgi:hypothetical protein
MAAGGHENHDDAVALLEVGDAGADLLDLAGGLMAQHHRHRAWPVAVDHREVGMAEARGADADQHLAHAGRSELDLLDPKRLRLRIGRGDGAGVQHGGAGLQGVSSQLRFFISALILRSDRRSRLEGCSSCLRKLLEHPSRRRFAAPQDEG